jgi:hypothetical protein
MKKIILLLIVSTLIGCAGMTQYQMNSDRNRIDPISIETQEQFQRDCQDCEVYANEWQRHANNEMLGRAIVGGILGAAMGAAVGGAAGGSNWAGRGAAIGGAEGTVAGAATTPNHRDQVFGNCMMNRGYQLLW